nr:MAG TPA: hypothetical protein [Caudoviricetes sp.]
MKIQILQNMKYHPTYNGASINIKNNKITKTQFNVGNTIMNLSQIINTAICQRL